MAHKEEILEADIVNSKQVKQRIWKYSWELMAVDDLSKCIVLDPLIGFSSHKVNRTSFLNGDINSIIEEKFKEYSPLTYENISKLQRELFDLVKSYRLLYKFNIQYLSWLELMVKSYFEIISVESPVNVEECNRYLGDNYKGVKISAKKAIKKGITLHVLTGYYKNIDIKTTQFLESQNMDFSIMKSNMKSLDVIMLGPAALLNHDCNPNCEYLSSTKDSIKIKTISNIQAGEELLVYYGNHFFGKENKDCACKSCEEDEEGCYKRVNGTFEYSQSLSISDIETNKNISILSVIQKETILSQADSLEYLTVGVDLKLNEVTIEKNIFSFNLMQLNALYYFLDQYLKFDKGFLHITDVLDDQTNIIISIDICTLIRKLNYYQNMPMLGHYAVRTRDCQANGMTKSELLELTTIDHGTSSEDNDDGVISISYQCLGFDSFSHDTTLENKLLQPFVKLIKIDLVDWKRNVKKYVCMKSEEKLKNLPLTRPQIGYLFCIYCDEFKTQLPRHLVLKHSDKTFVKNFLINFDTEKNKNAAMIFIRNQGFGHYYELTGKVIPVYCTRKDSQKDVAKVQCSNCFAHFSDETFQKHLKKCININITIMKNNGLL